jgi:Rrf2 family iron-sulfur cluster assembly transcriptional regulator
MKLQLMQRTELAWRAVRLLEGREEIMRASELAVELGTTSAYLPGVMRPLVRSGWLKSQPGPTGGYWLSTDLTDRSLLELIELMEGPTETGTCVLRGADCDESNQCALHDAWRSARGALMENLAEIPVSGCEGDER